ncbi:uncharacterized protein [Asterias amurensis]|uniref:uncharacterized protein n=1 Tax=Asterias amurensis TaxID=7602 RepID=UPI003AB2587B
MGNPRRKKHRCRFCTKTFDRPSKLTRHEALHTDKSVQPQLGDKNNADPCRNYLCDCGLGFKRKRSIIQHQMYCQIHTNRVKARESEKYESQQEKRPKKSKSKTTHEFRCDRCSSTFRSMERLQEHKKRLHNWKRVQPQPSLARSKKKRGSRVVDKTTITTHSSTMSTRPSPIKHVSSNKSNHKTEGKFLQSLRNREGACSICGKFLKRQNLPFHRKQHQLGILNANYLNEWTSKKQVLYMCRYETCNRAFLNEQQLSHHELFHVSSTPFMCDLCNDLFETESAHQNHVSTCMLGLRVNSCWYCCKFFGKGSNLTRHEEIHLKNMDPYFCGHCSKTTSTRPELNKHHINVHRNLKPGPNMFYQCKFCSIQLKSKSKLLKHAQSEHWSEIAGTSFTYGTVKLVGDEKLQKSSQSSETFDKEKALTEHKKITQEPFKCSKCKRSFRLRMALQRHYITNCRSPVATCSTTIHGATTATVKEMEAHDEDIISISSSSPSTSPSPSPPPSPPAGPEMQSVQIQRLKAVPVRRTGNTEVRHHFTVPTNSDCSFPQPRDQIYLIQYSSDYMSQGPLTLSLPDGNTSASVIRILPPDGGNLPVPIPVKLERVL